MKNPVSDYLILNSISMLFKIKNYINNYKSIELFLDNDQAGNNAVLSIKKWHKNVEDGRILYADYKDLNDFLLRKTQNNLKVDKGNYPSCDIEMCHCTHNFG